MRAKGKHLYLAHSRRCCRNWCSHGVAIETTNLYAILDGKPRDKCFPPVKCFIAVKWRVRKQTIQASRDCDSIPVGSGPSASSVCRRKGSLVYCARIRPIWNDALKTTKYVSQQRTSHRRWITQLTPILWLQYGPEGCFFSRNAWWSATLSGIACQNWHRLHRPGRQSRRCCSCVGLSFSAKLPRKCGFPKLQTFH